MFPHSVLRYYLFCSLISICIFTGQATAQCVNEGFEEGNLNGWTGYVGKNGGGSINFSQVAIPNATNHHLNAPGIDTVAGFPYVTQGNYSVRLGDSQPDGNAESMRYKFTVDNANKEFAFCFAIVLQDPGHDHKFNQKPYFRYRILDANGNVLKEQTYVADLSNPYFKTRGDIVYKDWDCVCTDLSHHLGKTLTLEFTVADCALGGHYGYAYLDGVCMRGDDLLKNDFTLNKTQYCMGESIIANGTASENETDYFWSVEESDANGGRPNPASERYDWFTGSQAGAINLEKFYTDRGGVWKCNTYYRIKLAIKNNCIQWKENIKLIRTSCPAMPPVRDLCCTETHTPDPLRPMLYLLQTPFQTPAGTVYNWQPSWLVEDSNSLNGYIFPKPTLDYPITFQLTGTNAANCSATANVTVYCGLPTLQIKREIFCCGTRLVATGSGISSYLWSTGARTSSISVNSPGTYSVTASSPCGSTMQSITVQNNEFIQGNFATLIYPQAFTPNGDGLNDEFIIYHYNLPAGASPAYQANAYRLTVFDRFGGAHIVAEKDTSDTTCEPLINGEIRWDGSINGTIVQQGVYSWILEMKNCSHKGWHRFFVRHKAKFVCDRKRWRLFCLCYECVSGHFEEYDTGPEAIDSVTVVR